MKLYEFLCLRLPKPVVDWGFVAVQAALIVLALVYSDKRFASFPYLKL